MCETPLETRFMLAETEVRAREMSAAFASVDLSGLHSAAARVRGLIRRARRAAKPFEGLSPANPLEVAE
jgi:hypothetical protein